MRLVVGLGNPGGEFIGTRHNVGWEVLDELAARLGWIAGKEDFDRSAKKKFDGLVLDGSIEASGQAERVLLLKPMTYMNLSGQSVQAAMTFYQLSPADVMVVLDDLALPCGKIRIRPSGSSGGHNGLKDIERVLGTNNYPRLRIGIDPPPPRIPGRDYVLGRYTKEQRVAIDAALKLAGAAILSWIEKGIATAMNVYNQDKPV
jgi:peptidyl-tRNA hydrolase, PTH1 family